MDEYITCLDTSHQNQSWVRFVIRDNDKVNSNEKGLSSIIDSFYDSGSGFFIYDDESFTNDAFFFSSGPHSKDSCTPAFYTAPFPVVWPTRMPHYL